jgi:two-component system, LuxR family, response regulator FixJ
MSIRPVVYVVEDDDAVRESLRFLLQTAHLPVRAYESAKPLLDALPGIEDGCVIADVKMPEIDGLELVRLLKRRKVGLPVIVITGHTDVPLAMQAMKAGAVDFIEKPYDGEVLLSAVQSALSAHEKHVRRDSERAEIRRRLAVLSQRERQVLDGLVAGRPNKAIANELGISARTVEIYRAQMMSKMQAISLSQLVRMALIAGNMFAGADEVIE